MENLVVNVKKLNKRRMVPTALPDRTNIAGVVFQNYSFAGEEVLPVPNPSLGKWFRDKDGYFYWGGGLNILNTVDDTPPAAPPADNTNPATGTTAPGNTAITPEIKTKIQRVVNAFETGSAEGDYSELVKYADYSDPETKTNIVQVTYGRSQTTEFGHLRSLVQDYVAANGRFADALRPYLNRIGIKPSLARDAVFCQALKDAGKDPIMQQTQDVFFDRVYYAPAFNWFAVNGFTLPLSMLVIYDSFVHSGSILGFLRKRFTTALPVLGGNEKEWINNYVEARQNWLANHPKLILRGTVYRTHCFQQQMLTNNWNLSGAVIANGIKIN